MPNEEVGEEERVRLLIAMELRVAALYAAFARQFADRLALLARVSVREAVEGEEVPGGIPHDEIGPFGVELFQNMLEINIRNSSI